MTNRELLERAAKAAGIKVTWREPVECFCYASSPYYDAWDPLTDDGDALRLAVKLGLTIDAADGTPDGNRDTPATRIDAADGRMLLIEAHGADPCAATRRAIVRAAAAMVPA